MRKLVPILLVILCFVYSCNSDDRITFTDLARLSVDSTEISQFKADGQSKLKLRLIFNEDSSIDDISAKVSVVNAVIENKTETEVTLTPEIRQKGVIGSEVTIVSTTNPDSTFIQFDVNKYFLNFKLKPKISEPSLINISKSTSSVLTNFRGEVSIVGQLTNSQGAKVSKGVKVRFTDELDDGSSAGGNFRAEALSSNSESKVSAIYSAGQIEANQFVTIKLEVLDSEGNPTSIETSTKVFVLNE